MNEKEKEIMDNLANAWNIFISLPLEHPDEVNEFRYKIHDIQRMVLIRQYRRTNNTKEVL